MNPEAGLIRAEQLKKWIDTHKEYLANALSTDKAEISFSMAGARLQIKVTQYPTES